MQSDYLPRQRQHWCRHRAIFLVPVAQLPIGPRAPRVELRKEVGKEGSGKERKEGSEEVRKRGRKEGRKEVRNEGS